MENYELYIPAPPKYNVINGQFLKGHIPFNKGIPIEQWMDGRKIRKVKKYLELGRVKGNKTMAGSNRKKVISIKDGILTAYSSMTEAEKILRQRGIKICARNISSVCCSKRINVGKYSYIRKRAGGYQWFFADDIEKYKNLINI